MNPSYAETSWERALADVRAYVERHEGIRITETGLSVPQEVRAAFYDKVSTVQDALVTLALRDSAKRTAHLSELCAASRDALIAGSDLVEFRLPRAIENAIENPRRALAAPAFTFVLDALRQNDDEAIAQEAACAVASHAKTLDRCMYELWAYYGVVAALRPVRFYEVFSPDTVQARAMPTGVVAVGEQASSPSKRMPEAVFETADGRVFAMKTEVARELDFYGAKIKRRRDMSLGGDSMDHMMHRVLLLYRIQSVDDVPLIADRDHMKVLASDLMLEALLPEDMGPGLSAAMFLERLDTVRSKRPIQVLTETSQGAFPDEVMADPRAALFERKIIGEDSDALADIASLLSA